MKIGILTLPLYSNYGGILQVYALQTFLEKKGHHVVVLRWKANKFNGYPFYRSVFIYAKRFLLGKEIRLEQRLQREREIRYQPLVGSISRMIHYSDCVINNEKELIDYCNKVNFDALIVGSDQVWRKSYGKSKSFFNRYLPHNSIPRLNTYYLDFADNLKKQPLRIAYAASFGVDFAEYDIQERKRLGILITKFDKVSTREKQGVDLISNIYKWRDDAKWVLDPTLLLTPADYHLLYNKQCSEEDLYILYYCLDETERKKEIVKLLSTRYCLKVIRVNPQLCSDKDNNTILPSIEEWLSLFAHANLIVTDSFHGMVFSILFNKNFYVFGNPKRGMSRFYSMLDLFELRQRMVDYDEEIYSFDQNDIDWNRVNSILNNMRMESGKLLNL